MELIHYGNLAVRFLLELWMLGALGYWGFSQGTGWLSRLGFGLGAPLVAAVIWGIFISPRATVKLSTPQWVALQAILFALTAAALFGVGQRNHAFIFLAVVAVNSFLLWRT